MDILQLAYIVELKKIVNVVYVKQMHSSGC